MAVVLAVVIPGGGAVSAGHDTALVAGGLTALPQAGLGPNLLRNGGFETLEGGRPAGWSATGAWTPDQLVKHSGMFSYRRDGGAPTSSQTIALPRGVYTLSAWIKTEGLGAGSGVRLQLDSRAGGINEWAPSGVISGTTDWTLYQVGPIVVATDRLAAVSLESYNDPPGTVWFDDVRLQQQQQPVDVFMLYPNYRGMLFDDQSQTMRFDVGVTPPAGDPAKYTIEATLAEESSATVIASQTYAGARHFVAELPGGAMHIGHAYLVTFALVDTTTGAAVYSHPAYRVSRVPGARRAAMRMAFDESNRVLVRGTPRFVLGIYDSGAASGGSDAFWEDRLWSATGERRMHGLRINTYLNDGYGAADAATLGALMSNLDKHGVAYLQTGHCFGTSPAAATTFAIDTSDTYVERIASHAGSAGYYTIDECASSLAPGAFAQYQRLKRLDPASVTFAALAPGGPWASAWRDSADIVATATYPMLGAEPAGGYPHGRVADGTIAAREAVKGARPHMTVLQFARLTSQGRWPSRSELRNHAWMAIVEGATGLWWRGLGDHALLATCAGWCAEKTQHMDDLEAVVNEIADLEPALLAPDATAVLTSNSNTAAIRTKVKVVGGTGYLFAYNATNAAASATFGWSTTPGSVRVNVEDRVIAPSGASFSDTFAPYQAHVYLITDGGHRPVVAGTAVTPTVRN
jgi:hypothetical protein